MDITLPTKALVRALSRTHAAADRKGSLPILTNILLEADPKRGATFQATDLFLGVSCRVEADVRKPGKIALQARTFFDVARALPEGEVRLSVEDTQAHLRSGKVRYDLPALAGNDFPPLPSAEKKDFFELEAPILADLIARTHYAMSSDESRPHLSGALFEVSGAKVRMVTTDGHRLSKAELACKPKSRIDKLTMLLPARGINELKRLIDDLRSEQSKQSGKAEPLILNIALQGSNAFFRADDVQLNVRLAAEQFPPYEKVIPQRSERKVRILRERLLEGLKRVNLMSRDRSGSVKLELKPGVLKITSENPEIGHGEEELDVEFAGEPVEIGFNARYIIDVLGALPDDEVVLELSGSLDPGVIKPAESTDFVGVVMPMRV